MVTGYTTEGVSGSAGCTGVTGSSNWNIGSVPPPNSPGANEFIDSLMKRDKEEFPTYIKSFEGFGCVYNWDRQYNWYEIYWNHDMYLQVQSNVTPESFIDLMVGFFTDAWDELPVFLASDKTKKEIFELCSLFPEFNEKIKGLEINLVDEDDEDDDD